MHDGTISLMDWGALQAQQQQAGYQSAFQLGGDEFASKVMKTPVLSAAAAERKSISRQTAAVLPLHRASAHDSERENSQQELARLRKLSSDVWPASKHGSAHREKRSSAGAMLKHYTALNDRVFPKERAHAAEWGATSASMLTHWEKVSSKIWPREHSRRAMKAQTSQAMLKHFAALNARVFPKDTTGKQGHVQDV